MTICDLAQTFFHNALKEQSALQTLQAFWLVPVEAFDLLQDLLHDDDVGHAGVLLAVPPPASPAPPAPRQETNQQEPSAEDHYPDERHEQNPNLENKPTNVE